MFSPRTFADLFRILAEEVAQHGYHFNDTAKTVAERLAGAGRNVTSRQVVFVVKGLALKGHVFSTNDTAERLAEVFREQARYLIGGAGITLDADREALLAAWIAAPAAPAAKPARPTRPAPENKPARAAEPPADSKPARKPAPERRAEKPTAAKPATPRVPERPKSAALPSRTAPPPPDTAEARQAVPRFQGGDCRAHRRLGEAQALGAAAAEGRRAGAAAARTGRRPGEGRGHDRIVDPGGDRRSRRRSGRGRRQRPGGAPLGAAGTRGHGSPPPAVRQPIARRRRSRLPRRRSRKRKAATSATKSSGSSRPTTATATTTGAARQPPDQPLAMYCPPLALSTAPVMKAASSDARKATSEAISSALPSRPTGICATMPSSTFSGTPATMSVST